MRQSKRFHSDVDKWAERYHLRCQEDVTVELSELIIPHLKSAWPLALEADIDHRLAHRAIKGDRLTALATTVLESGLEQLMELSESMDEEVAA